MSFDRLAPHYDWMEAVLAGRLLQRVRTQWLDRLVECRSILSVGEGHGRFAAACVKRFPSARLTCVDASPAMLAHARRRIASPTESRCVEPLQPSTTFIRSRPENRPGDEIPNAGSHSRVSSPLFSHQGPDSHLSTLDSHLTPAPLWHRAELPADPLPAGPFDAIVTNFFLDCFPPDTLSLVIDRLAATAAPDALWLVGDFAIPARGLARGRARAVHALMYRFFRVVTRLPARRLTPPDPLMNARGFRLEQRRTFNAGLLQADVWRRCTRSGSSSAADGQRDRTA